MKIIHHLLHFLLYVVKGISSLNFRERRTILNRISTLQGKSNTHAWNIQRSFRSNHLPFIPGRGQGHHKRLQDHTHTQCVQDVRL
jgi:hypothetical protein